MAVNTTSSQKRKWVRPAVKSVAVTTLGPPLLMVTCNPEIEELCPVTMTCIPIGSDCPP